MVDPIADFLTRIRNAQMAGSKSVTIPFSKLKGEIAKVMLKNKFLKKVKVEDTDKDFKKNLVLNLPEEILTLTRNSKSGQRQYVGASDIRKVLNGLGIAVISTSKGVMTGYEARALGVGGEILCEVS